MKASQNFWKFLVRLLPKVVKLIACEEEEHFTLTFKID